jgi:hypothetical protein
VLSVLVYGYALIISTAMPWGLQILFMALLTIAVFFYRRPFQHLFASMGGHTLTTRMLGEAASSPVLERASNVLPPVASARIGRWGARKAEPLIHAATGGVAGGVASAVAQGRARGEESEGTATPSGVRVPAPLDTDQQGGKAAGRQGPAPRQGDAPPLNLGGTPTRSRGASPGAGPRGTGGRSGASGTSGASGGGSGGGGWFGGRSGGGWAPRGGSSGSGGSGGSRSGGSRSGGSRFGGSGGSGGSRSGGSRFGGSGGSRRSRWSDSRSNGSSNGSSGGGIFGRNPDGRVFGGGGSGGGGMFGGSSGSSDRRASEPPPLWGSSRKDEPPVPFWLNPSNPDKD